jgi:hypothetical protein
MARRLAARWHDLWTHGCRQMASYSDQPAFNVALHEIQPRIKVLAHAFNAQVRVQPATAADALVWHLYASGVRAGITSFEQLVEQLRQHGTLDRRAVAKMAHRGHPWRRDHFVDDFVARKLARRGRLAANDVLWLEGRRMEACGQWLKQAALQLRATRK